jgi:hypothetical protein
MDTRIRRQRFTVACLVLAALCFAAAGSTSAAAKKARPNPFVVSTPLSGPVPLGRIPVRAKLKVKRSAKVRRARFYINGRLVTTDKRFPFEIRRSVRFDSRELTGGSGLVVLRVRFEQKTARGKLVRRTLVRKLNLTTGDGTGGQIGEPSGETDPLPLNLPYDPEQLPPCPIGMIVCENFDGSSLDRRLWNDQRTDAGAGSYPWYAWNAELEGAHYSPQNVAVGSGKLTLTVTDVESGNDPAYPQHLRPKTTGSVNTDGKFAFRYGTMESRIKFDFCTACWQSFWLHNNDPNPQNSRPEFDIMEFMPWAAARSPHTVLHGLHGPPAVGGVQYGNFAEPLAGYNADLAGTWHTYRIKRTPSILSVMIDNKPEWSYSSTDPDLVSANYTFPIFSMAILNPTKAAGIGINPIPLPAPAGTKLEVDYFKVWRIGYAPGS